MSETGKKLAACGFVLQGAAGLGIDLTYLFAGQTLEDVFYSQAAGGPVAALAGIFSTLSGVGMIASAAGFAYRYVERRKGSDLAVAALMIISLIIAFFTPAYGALQPVLGWAYMAVMAVTAARRKKTGLMALMCAALALRIAGGTVADLLPNTPTPQSLFSAAVNVCSCTALTLYAWRIDGAEK